METTKQQEKSKGIELKPNWERALDFLWLEITPKCNLNCVHCYAESTPFNPLNNRMTFQDWINVMKESFELGCTKIQFIGGEPTIHPDLLNLLTISKNIGYEFIEVFTNGTVLNEDMFSAFKKNNVNLAFSFYSFQEETHNKITNRKWSYRKTTDSIKKALQYGLKIRVGIIEMEKNSSDIEQTVNYLKKLGVHNISVDSKREIGRGLENAKTIDPMSQLCGSCWKGRLVVDSNGNVFPCVFSRFNIIGSINGGIASILQKNELHSFRKTVKHLYEKRINNRCLPDGDCVPPCRPFDAKSERLQTFMNERGGNTGPCSPYRNPCPPDSSCIPYDLL